MISIELKYCDQTNCFYRLIELLQQEGTAGDHLIQDPGSEKGQEDKDSQGWIQLAFNYIQRWRLQNISG